MHMHICIYMHNVRQNMCTKTKRRELLKDIGKCITHEIGSLRVRFGLVRMSFCLCISFSPLFSSRRILYVGIAQQPRKEEANFQNAIHNIKRNRTHCDSVFIVGKQQSIVRYLRFAFWTEWTPFTKMLLRRKRAKKTVWERKKQQLSNKWHYHAPQKTVHHNIEPNPSHCELKQQHQNGVGARDFYVSFFQQSWRCRKKNSRNSMHHNSFIKSICSP